MIRFRRRLGPVSAFVVFCGFLSRVALGAPNDAEASKLRQQAIEQDYLATDFAAAETKLVQALALCKDSASCTPALRARIHCDFGVVYFAEQKKDEADAQFAAAVKDDPGVGISVDLATPELQKELAAVKGSAKPAGESEGKAETTEPEASGEKTEATTPPKKSSSSETNDCPPGFPGCKSNAAGTTCSTNDDCSGGETCHDGTCSGGGGEEEAAEDITPKANWLSLAVEEDLLLLPSANKVCAGGSGYTCFASNGDYFSQAPLTGANTADSVNGGLSPATTRFLVGYDRAFGRNFTLGARVGFAIGGGPTRPGGTGFLPLHLEGRATYWIGHNALAHKGFRFFALVAGGAAEVDSSLAAFAYSQNAAANSAPGQYQAWKKTGQAFGAVGLGTMFAITPNSGIVLEIRAMELFPTSGTAIGAQLGYTFGL